MRVLIVDDEPEIREITTVVLEGRFNIEAVQCASGNEAADLLKSDQNFLAVISDLRMPNGTGADLLKFMVSNNVNVPFILCTASPKDDLDKGIDTSKLHGLAMKPGFIVTIQELVEKLIKESSSKPYLKETNYFSIPVSLIKVDSVTPTDLYVKLGEDKYLKFFHKGVVVTTDEQQRIAKSKISRLYCIASDLDLFSKSILSNLEKTFVIQSPTPPQQVRVIELSKTALECISGFSKTMGITKEVQTLVNVTLSSTLRSLQTFATDTGNPAFDHLMDLFSRDPDSYFSTHSMALAYIAPNLARIMEWDSLVTSQKLVLAALLHDLPIPDFRLAMVEDMDQLMAARDQFTDVETDQIVSHPKKTIELCEGYPPLTEDVRGLILQHHEKPDGSGFPSGMTHAQIPPLSALFNFSHLLVSQFIKSRKTDFNRQHILEFIKQLPPEYRQGSFKDVLRNLEKRLNVPA